MPQPTAATSDTTLAESLEPVVRLLYAAATDSRLAYDKRAGLYNAAAVLRQYVVELSGKELDAQTAAYQEALSALRRTTAALEAAKAEIDAVSGRTEQAAALLRSVEALVIEVGRIATIA